MINARTIRHWNETLKRRFPRLQSILRDTAITLKILRWWPEVKVRDMLGLPMRDRAQLGVLLRVRGLRGEGVEVGVLTGYFSELLLRLSNLHCLHSVDPWKVFPGEEYDDVANTPQAEHDKKYAQTVERLKPYGSRSHIIRATSEEASPTFADGSVDFVYIDANHSYEGCRDDINFWWPKIRKGGIIAGHDYVDGMFPEGNFGVKRAVDEFAAASHQRVFVVPVLWPTWYVIKS